MAIHLKNFEAGRWEKGPGYKYFIPTKINDQWSWEDPVLNLLLEQASIKLGELNAFARFVPNIDLFIQLHVKKEAVISSRIEGTQTNIKEAVLPESEINPERRDDWNEVNNYTIALNMAISNLRDLPLSSRLLRKTHKVLLSGVRGKHKLPGEFRKSQNWIGGSSLQDATFIPPAHHYISELMADLEKFLHNTNINVPALVKIGIVHYQFETIHPFLDGNGRIGRLLITLFLVSEGILEKPLLYLSSYFEKNRGLYYDNLTKVRSQNDLRQWLKYFLVGIDQTAQKAVHTLRSILDLKLSIEEEIKTHWGKRSKNGLVLLEYLLDNPVIDVNKASEVCNLSKKAAGDLVSKFEEYNILIEITGQSRNRLFAFEKYLKEFE